MEILLPLGISFFTFQQISYLVDCYKGIIHKTNIINYALFVTFFPQLIAGPIVQYNELLPQFVDNEKKKFNSDNFYKGFILLALGLFKKVILADSFIPFIDAISSNFDVINFYSSWLYSLSIAFEGYFDFSGYCDMALGLGYMFNIVLPINFNSPYKSVDISDFWRRWHITLGRFLKNYVYIPLGGSRVGMYKTYRNLLITFILVGIWHGAKWTCIFFGVLNGILVCINKLWKKYNIQMNKYLAISITFVVVVFIAPLMQINSMSSYVEVAKTMLAINTNFHLPELVGYDLIFGAIGSFNIFLLLGSLITIFVLPNSIEISERFYKMKSTCIQVIFAVIFVLSILSMHQTVKFIYFQF